jgi:hypothetical protein
MHPLLRGAACAAVLGALSGLEPAPERPTERAAAPHGTSGMAALCAKRSVPEGDACVPLPPAGALLDDGEAASGARSPSRRSETRERIPRRPDRPADAARYVFPVGSAEHVPEVLRGLDVKAAEPSRAAFEGVELAAGRAEPVKLVALEHQQGDAEIAFVGDLDGPTVITTHAVELGGRVRTYLVVLSGLGHAEPDLAPGAKPKPGAPLGVVGDAARVRLDIRQVREGVDLAKIAPSRLVTPSVSVSCDARNVLPLR